MDEQKRIDVLEAEIKELQEKYASEIHELKKYILNIGQQIYTHLRDLFHEQQTHIGLHRVTDNLENMCLGELELLCDIYGTDKGSCMPGSFIERPYTWPPHTYAGVYEKLFEKKRDKIQYVFECGLGTNNTNVASSMGVYGRPGASLRVWREYFPNIACVYGADVDTSILFSEEKIETGYLDQTKIETIDAYFDNLPYIFFDIMIDDGLHTGTAAINLFAHSHKRLKEDGIYIIEDVDKDSICDIYSHIKTYDAFQMRICNMNSCTYDGNSMIIITRK